MITHTGKEFVLGVSHAPTSRGGVPALPNFGGSLLFMRAPFVAELSYMESGVYRGVSKASHPKRAEFQRSPVLGGSPVFRLMSTPFNAERHVGRGVF